MASFEDGYRSDSLLRCSAISLQDLVEVGWAQGTTFITFEGNIHVPAGLELVKMKLFCSVDKTSERRMDKRF